MKSRIVLHPLLFGIFPVLLIYAHNIDQAQLEDVYLPLLASLVLALVLWGGLTLLIHHVRAAALATSLLLLLFHSYGHVLLMAEHTTFEHHLLIRARYLFPLWATIAIAGTYFIVRHRRENVMNTLTTKANFFSVLMILFSLLQIGYFQLHKALTPNANIQTSNESYLGEPSLPSSIAGEKVGQIKGSPTTLPDIYYIIPDSYEADSSLRIDFNYDNSAFTDFLKKRGFFVASKSTSNYAFTMPSLTSSLNMELLSSFPELPDRNSLDMTPLGKRMENNKVMAFLKARGYTIINAGSWLGSTYASNGADIRMQSDHLTEFAITVLKGTILFQFSEELLNNSYRKKVLFVFDNLAKIPKMPEPTFTLAHIICPHPPYVFGPNGEKVSVFARAAAVTNSRKLYLDQVKFMNQKLEEAVDKILAESATPPIIIIQADHGAAYTGTKPDFVNVIPPYPYCKEQMRILNAYYLPGPAGKGAVYDSISPVNTFRSIFNAYFGAHFPMVENKSFLSNRILPYAFMDVTEIVKYRN